MRGKEAQNSPKATRGCCPEPWPQAFPSAFLSHTLPGHFHLPLLSHTNDVSEIPSSFSFHTRRGTLLSFIKTGAKHQNQKVMPPYPDPPCLPSFIFFPAFLENNLLLKMLKIIFVILEYICIQIIYMYTLLAKMSHIIV